MINRKIKILHVQETIGSGGVERRRLSLAKFLDSDKYEQRFICTHSVGNIAQEIEDEGWKVTPVGSLKSPFNWKVHKKIQKIIDVYKPDIIHGAVFEGVTMAAINGWLKKVPIVIIEETSDPQNRTWKGDFLFKVFSNMADAVVGVSEAVTEEYFKDKLNLNRAKIKLIRNGVKMPRPVPQSEISQTKEKYGIQTDDFVIGSIGRMLSDDHKRYSDLIKAFETLTKQHSNCKLLLVGEGPLRETYEKQSKKLKVSDKVIFTGYQPDVSLFYQLMDVFALFSGYESFGLVVAEAMLNKLPTIVTKVGGMKYIVQDKETGFLVEKFNIEQMVEKLNYLYEHNNERKRMGQNGYDLAIKEYTEHQYVKKVTNLYDELVQKKFT